MRVEFRSYGNGRSDTGYLKVSTSDGRRSERRHWYLDDLGFKTLVRRKMIRHKYGVCVEGIEEQDAKY